MLSVQCCYSVQINRGSSTLQLLGPIAGVASDACTLSLARRRPFLIVGAFLTSVALIVFSNADALRPWLAGSDGIVGSATGDLVDPAGERMGIILAAIQAPLRALVTDVASERQQVLGNSDTVLMTGMGNLVGSLLSSVCLVVIMPWFRTSVHALFTLSAFVFLTTVGLCVWFVKEDPIFEDDEEESGDAASSASLVNNVPASSYGAISPFVTGSTAASPDGAATPAVPGGWQQGRLSPPA
ncbi:hypothetical protein I4F81_005149 [Pyropia yezoensis]|uniref:Uncharacterized protein n=1 Tax=Pyropia yezoensis TaxID=2788 RepID=A0ACC3BYM0_PYRYE|nr:hypothetical protein I4F81_005149 [Neopyropia yezoensis]